MPTTSLPVLIWWAFGYALSLLLVCARCFFDSLQVTALFPSQQQAFRVRLEGDAAVAMECDNLLGTCFLLRLRRKMFEYVKFSSVTGKVLRVLSAPTLRFVHVECRCIYDCHLFGVLFGSMHSDFL